MNDGHVVFIHVRYSETGLTPYKLMIRQRTMADNTVEAVEIWKGEVRKLRIAFDRETTTAKAQAKAMEAVTAMMVIDHHKGEEHAANFDWLKRANHAPTKRRNRR